MSLRERLFPQSIKEVANHPNQQKLDELDNLLLLCRCHQRQHLALHNTAAHGQRNKSAI